MTKSAATRVRILEVALELFRERGFSETTMRDVAGAAGVATGASYYYFRSKEELVMAFYERAVEEMEPALLTVLASEQKLEPCLRRMISAKLDYFAPNRKLLGALIGQAADLASPLSPFGTGWTATDAGRVSGAFRGRPGTRPGSIPSGWWWRTARGSASAR